MRYTKRLALIVSVKYRHRSEDLSQPPYVRTHSLAAQQNDKGRSHAFRLYVFIGAHTTTTASRAVLNLYYLASCLILLKGNTSLKAHQSMSRRSLAVQYAREPREIRRKTRKKGILNYKVEQRTNADFP